MSFRSVVKFNRLNTIVYKRMMSGHSADEAKSEAQKWLKITIGKYLLLPVSLCHSMLCIIIM